MIQFPPCKVNLGLRILKKREDGYHELETAFYPVPLCDVLEVAEAPATNGSKVNIVVSGVSIDGDPQSNLVVKAYHLLGHDYPLPPVDFHLLKQIPMGAGLGGGSSDGASALLLLNKRFKLGLDHSQLETYAAALGSDCAFFITGKPAIGRGRGEQLTTLPLSLKGKWIALIKPSFSISTAEAYAECRPCGMDKADQLEAVLNGLKENWKTHLVNDFEFHLFEKYPELDRIKTMLYQSGAWYASMSGSGSTMFGLFDERPNLKDKFPGSFYWEGELTV